MTLPDLKLSRLATSILKLHAQSWPTTRLVISQLMLRLLRSILLDFNSASSQRSPSVALGVLY